MIRNQWAWAVPAAVEQRRRPTHQTWYNRSSLQSVVLAVREIYLAAAVILLVGKKHSEKAYMETHQASTVGILISGR